jgi:hypothetical protein
MRQRRTIVEPPHVHVAKGDASAKVWLNPVRIDYAYGFSPAEMRRLREMVLQHEATFLEQWDEYFGR